VNQEESEHNEVDGMKKGVDSTGKVVHNYLRERSVICNDEDIESRARVTAEKEPILQILHVD